MHTGKRVVRNNWTILPMPAEVISTVHQLEAACKKYIGITYTDKDGNIIYDDNDPDSIETEEFINPETSGVDTTDTNTHTLYTTGVDTTGVNTTDDTDNENGNTDVDFDINGDTDSGNTSGNHEN